MSNKLKKIKQLLRFSRLLLPSYYLRKIPKDKKRYVGLVFGGILVVLIPLAISLTIHPTKSEAAWFDDNWLYRQGITLTNTTTETLKLLMNVRSNYLYCGKFTESVS